MKRLLKYLLPIIVVTAFWNGADNAVSNASEPVIVDISTIECTDHSSNFSKSESKPCLPRQLSFTSPLRAQNAARRTAGIQRLRIEFTKSDKVINPGLRQIILRNSTIIHSTLIEPVQRLLYLGKLVI